MDKSLLAANLKILRLNCGYAQKNIADMLGVNRSTYTYYEAGKTMPDVETLNKLAKFYEISIDAFFEPVSKIHKEQKRPGKWIADTVSEIKGLTAEEKSIIAILRSRDGYTQELLAQIKSGS